MNSTTTPAQTWVAISSLRPAGDALRVFTYQADSNEAAWAILREGELRRLLSEAVASDFLAHAAQQTYSEELATAAAHYGQVDKAALRRRLIADAELHPWLFAHLRGDETIEGGCGVRPLSELVG